MKPIINLRKKTKLKNNNFSKALEEEKKNTAMFENAVKKVIAEKGEQDIGARNGFTILINSYQKQINLLCSCGENLQTIRECFSKLIWYYGKMWDRSYGYIELIKVLSLAVLLDIDKSELNELKTKLISENFDDRLVNFLMKQIDSSWDKDGTDFEFEVYDILAPILAKDEKLDCDFIKKYLQEDWKGIYNSNDIDCTGCWSFEAGAIVKILKLNDLCLRDIEYYPYDLVHSTN